MFNTFLPRRMTKIIPRFRNAAITSYVNLFNTSQFPMPQNWDNLRLIVLSTELFPNSPSGRSLSMCAKKYAFVTFYPCTCTFLLTFES